MCGEEGKTYKNTPVSVAPSVTNWFRLETYCLYLKDKWIFQEFWRLLFFFLSFRRREKITASHKGSDSNRDRAFQEGDLVEKTLKFKHDEVPERTLRSNCFDLQEGNDVTRVCWAGVM